MAYTEETYRSFIEQTSKDMLRTIGTQMLVAKHEHYLTAGNDFLKEQKHHTPLANYHFTIDTLDLTLSSSSKDSVDISHKTSLIPYMTHHTLKTVQEVEKDAVGLAGFKDTIQPFYIKQLTHGVHKEIDSEFVTTMTDDFIPDHHFKWLNGIQAVLHGL